MPEHTESFYDALGGEPALRRLINTFYDQVLVDPLLELVFAHFTPTHIDHVVVWLSEVFGGPAGYTERLGGHQARLTGVGTARPEARPPRPQVTRGSGRATRSTRGAMVGGRGT